MRKTLAFVLTIALVALPATAQAEDPKQIEIAAHDDADSCEDADACLEDVDYSWGGVYAGDEIEVTFDNEGEQAYSLAIVPGAEKNENGETSTEEAFLETGPVEPGASATVTATVPEGTETAYLFTEEAESEGMHLVRNVYPADARGEQGNYSTMQGEGSGDGSSASDPADKGPGSSEVNEAPLPLAMGLVALAAAAGLRRQG